MLQERVVAFWGAVFLSLMIAIFNSFTDLWFEDGITWPFGGGEEGLGEA